MKLNLFTGATSFALLVTSTVPAFAQSDRPSDSTPPPGAKPGDQPATPPSSAPVPTEEAPKDAPPPPATDRPTPEPAAESATASPSATGDVVSPDLETADTGTTKRGETLSSLIVTAGLGYAYAAVNHPELASRNLSGAFVEVTAGTELDPRFRLSLAFTSFETKLHRTSTGKWAEGEYLPKKVASGLHTAADPIEPVDPQGGGVTVQKMFHAHSIGPRMDFLPLGSQGPYLGMTAAVAVIQDVATRVGADLAARVGGEWRPFHSLGLAIEAGAHGQIYDDSRAAIPYALARLSLMLEPEGTQSTGRKAIPTQFVMPRTLPAPPPR
jgi:hypothetical protein